MVKDKTEKYGKRRNYNPNFKGPVKSRGCTDVICLLILVGFSVLLLCIGVIALQSGNPKTLIYPSNSEGELCGQYNEKSSSNLTNQPYLLFFDITKCLFGNVVGGCSTPQVSLS